MGYTALLFCPEEKTARTVTQVLSELEFTVEACTEPFAAVKKLMGQHFDAVVVDCDNEQNATLLFKSARNSTSNQTSLAVAVVEGQAGVAKAFRIGANLVLTKPINIEQSKGTLRVARGLLRKSEPAKAAGPTPTPNAPATPAKAVTAKAIPETKAAATAVPPLTAEATSVPVVKPTPAWPSPALASATAKDDDLLDIDGDEPKKSVVATDSHPAGTLTSAPTGTATSQRMTTSGAASAPAPAREHSEPPVVEKAPEITAAVSTPGKSEGSVESSPSGIVGSAPSFSFGGETESGGSSKKIIIGVAAAIVLVAGLYAGVTHFRGAQSQSAQSDVPPSIPSETVSQPVAKATSHVEKPSAIAASSQTGSAESNKIQHIIDETAGESHSTGKSADKSVSDTSAESEPEPEPLLVKGGKIATKVKTVADAPAPSMIGLATPDAAEPPAGLVPTEPTLRPTLSTLHVSQGVSTGLLIKKVAPSYPPNALRMRIEGDVDLLATISKEGKISQIKALSGNSQLTKAAIDAVKQWKYKPYLLNGEPVEIQTQVTVKFKLPN